MNDELKNIFDCLISDDRKHNVALVYQIQKSILADLKCKVPGLSTIICFTDGCDGWYKNQKNFHICQHKSDFGLNVRQVFKFSNRSY